ncbi:phosphate transport system substrate-binding protein [Desulfosarcina sp. BuS5]|nr:phosphate transport system substrate-binding protein [Desulfosarcina sp. BuS5]
MFIMTRFLFFILAFFLPIISGCQVHEASNRITGAGASFPAPVYRAWSAEYSSRNPVIVRYKSVGSSEGIRFVKSGKVDFGASDITLSAEELEQEDLIQIPVLIGGVAVVINMPGIINKEMVFSGPVLVNIFMGRITKWDDPEIKKLNPNLRLPERSIAVVFRSDGSGTAWLFTQYLNSVSSTWKTGPGSGDRIIWPTGTGASKNEGVLRKVIETQGAIGFVEYTYAKKAGIACASLINRSGRSVNPSIQTFYAAAVKSAENQSETDTFSLINLKGEECWPITGYTYILLHKTLKSEKKAKALIDFLTWCYGEKGKKITRQLHYLPIEGNISNQFIQKIKSYLLQDTDLLGLKTLFRSSLNVNHRIIRFRQNIS